MRNILTIAGVAALVIIIGVESFLFIQNKSSDSIGKPADPLAALWSGNYTKEKNYWKEQINKVGTEKAYELFKEDTAGKEFGITHTLAHVFGELIYEKEGVKGIVVCDSAFAFGCYHSFFGKAITEHGIDVVPELDKLCVERWGPIGLGCPHGIGHGVLGYLGDDKLVEALDICAKLSWKGVFGGCQSGVFMEYNFHTMQSLQGVESRSFDPKKPLYPCDAVPKAFSQACYFELPAWLSSVIGGDYAATGKICATIKNSVDKKACYIGLGSSIAPNSQYDVNQSITTCSSMPDKQAVVFCRAGAAWSFFAEPTTRDRKSLLCDGLSASEQKICLSESEIIK